MSGFCVWCVYNVSAVNVKLCVRKWDSVRILHLSFTSPPFTPTTMWKHHHTEIHLIRHYRRDIHRCSAGLRNMNAIIMCFLSESGSYTTVFSGEKWSRHLGHLRWKGTQDCALWRYMCVFTFFIEAGLIFTHSFTHTKQINLQPLFYWLFQDKYTQIHKNISRHAYTVFV